MGEALPKSMWGSWALLLLFLNQYYTPFTVSTELLQVDFQFKILVILKFEWSEVFIGLISTLYFTEV